MIDSSASLSVRRQRLASLEVWVETVEDRCTRVAYLNWIYYYKRDLGKEEDVATLAGTFPKPPG